MHDDADFLRAILTNPFDDAPRLIYAEWLEDRAHEEGGFGFIRNDSRVARAEFIRIQIELSLIEKEAGHPVAMGCHCGPCIRSRPMQRREAKLYANAETVFAVNTVDIWPVEVRRGFISSIFCTLATFMRHAAEIFSKHPVTEVRLTDREPLWLSQTNSYTFSHGNDLLGSNCNLPKAIWDELIENDRLPILPSNWKNYSTTAAAHLALSRACVDYGRSLAGLPPLTWLAVENAGETSESRGFNVSSILCR